MVEPERSTPFMRPSTIDPLLDKESLLRKKLTGKFSLEAFQTTVRIDRSVNVKHLTPTRLSSASSEKSHHP